MAVPEYQKFFLPVLKIAGDKKDHSYGEMYSVVAKEFKLTEEDRAELLPSGTAKKFENRVAWTITYLSKARLLDRVARGVFRISERGQQVLQKNPTELNNKFLRQFQSSLNLREGHGFKLKKKTNSKKIMLEHHSKLLRWLIRAYEKHWLKIFWTVLRLALPSSLKP